MNKAISFLFTDLYELTMAAAYRKNCMDAIASFSLYIRGSSQLNRGYFIAAGLEDALNGLEQMRFSQTDVDYLYGLNLFPKKFLQSLLDFRFSGTVWAMPEGTVCFADEPLLEVTAPIAEAQVVETFLINTIGFQTNIATKAARCVHAAKGRPLVDFSLRRTHGLDAGMQVARSTYLSGFAGTSNVLAGRIYGIPLSGTMAHSFVLAFQNDSDAFHAYARTFPDNSIFLIDTTDVILGALDAVKIAKDMKSKGHQLKGVRIDSGNMVQTSGQIRQILDDAGLHDIQIVATSGFDEYMIESYLDLGAAIDAFGVGTKIGVSADTPYLDMVYKMARYGERNVKKLSPEKVTLAGEKQVFRRTDESRGWVEDIVGVRNEYIDGTKPLLEKRMADGKCLIDHPSLQDIRNNVQINISNLNDEYKSFNQPALYPVRISRRLYEIQ